jgi:hypothetical protein
MKTILFSMLLAGGIWSSSATAPNATADLPHKCEVTVGDKTVKCDRCNCKKILKMLLAAEE